MSQDVIDIILEKLNQIEAKVSKIEAFINRCIGYGIAASAFFAFLFDTLKEIVKNFGGK